MKKKIIRLASTAALIMLLLNGCASSESQEAAGGRGTETEDTREEDTAEEPETIAEESEEQTDRPVPTLEDGVYTAEFDSDSSMFHVNETCEGKGVLTVENGEMVIHVSLASKNIVNLFPGSAKDARKNGAELLEPTTDSITYSDGITEEVYGFDIPVPALEEEFDLALIGTKGTWYDHKVSVSNPERLE